ncbi:hypothetical protein BN1221_02555 [Brenneria goodwinii]|uniref:Uncharacterized protein n=1 Tax=Brenneria goodwinii TaxID=1109412 RepID=A0A0G4JVZ8_9GAMM|nr:hypothetical protein BN1221_02555 [Brenneria goodwinii]
MCCSEHFPGMISNSELKILINQINKIATFVVKMAFILQQC